MYKWIGENVIGIPGVPARDLSDEEAEEFGVTDSQYYEHVETEPQEVKDAQRD